MIHAKRRQMPLTLGVISRDITYGTPTIVTENELDIRITTEKSIPLSQVRAWGGYSEDLQKIDRTVFTNVIQVSRQRAMGLTYGCPSVRKVTQTICLTRQIWGIW